MLSHFLVVLHGTVGTDSFFVYIFPCQFAAAAAEVAALHAMIAQSAASCAASIAMVLTVAATPVISFSGLNTTAVAAETDLADVGAGYGLWVGSTQVTDANKNDILSADTKVTIDDATHLQRYLAEDG